MNATAGGGMVPGEIPVTEHVPRSHETPPPAVVLALTRERLQRFHVSAWLDARVDSR